MSKKKWSGVLAILLLVQSVISSPVLSFEGSFLNPPTQPFSLVLYEGTIADPAITFQVLPSLNEILSDCKSKPIKLHSLSATSRSA